MTAVSELPQDNLDPAGVSPGSKAAGIAAAIVTVLIVVGGIGYGAWAMFGGPKQENLIEVQPSIAQRIAAGAPGGNRGPVEFVRQTKNGVSARAGDVKLDANHPNKDKPWKTSVTYLRGDLVSPQQNAALTARYRLTIDPVFAKSANVSPEQIKQLGAIEIGTAPIMPLSDEEQKQLGQLCQQFFDASDKGPAQAALLRQLQAWGPAKLAATKQEIATRAAAVEKILTPEQIKPFMAK